jgi:hypothetical protein
VRGRAAQRIRGQRDVEMEGHRQVACVSFQGGRLLDARRYPQMCSAVGAFGAQQLDELAELAEGREA